VAQRNAEQSPKVPPPVTDRALMRRLDRLHAELVDEALPVPLDGETGEILLRELLYARDAPAHENRPARYGALVLDESGGVDETVRRRLSELAAEVVPLDGYDLDAARRFADGRSSFLVRDTRTAALACFPHSVEYEAALVELERSTGGIVVQRRVDGSLRLCSSDGVIVWVGHRWRFTPNSARFADVIAHLVPQADRNVLVGLLDLCVHWLSAGRVGATLVWYLVEGSARVGTSRAGLDVSRAIQAPPLSLLERTHRPALLSALAQLDRAVLVQPTGRLTHLNVGLVPSPAAVTTVPAIRGTRHTSARRFSFDEPRAVVAVVSQDGGVTVFSDGAPIELARTVPTGRSAIADHQRPSVESVTHCPGCDRAILVEDTGPAAGGSGITCPVCASPISATGAGARAAGVRKVLG
jgi:hypothetical protein